MNTRGSTTSNVERLWPVAAVLLAVCAALGVYFLQSVPPPQSVPLANAPASRPSSIALITQEARDLKLITWSFETTVDAQSVSDKWYGDSIASVRAPVRYQYGVDLTTLEEGSIFRDANTGQVLFIVHPPTRLSVEIDIERLEESLRTSGMRWKSRNQEQLDDTRRQLGEIARNLELSRRDEQRMREASREQIEMHLQRVLARIEPGVMVGVKFAD